MSRIRECPFVVRSPKHIHEYDGLVRWNFQIGGYIAKIIDHHIVIATGRGDLIGEAIVESLKALGKQRNQDPRCYLFDFPYGWVTWGWEHPDIGRYVHNWFKQKEPDCSSAFSKDPKVKLIDS